MDSLWVHYEILLMNKKIVLKKKRKKKSTKSGFISHQVTNISLMMIGLEFKPIRISAEKRIW
jgi:hypothetical protein